MPELPEVEYGRVLAEAVVSGRTIDRVRCTRDDIVYDGCTTAAVRKALTGRTVHAVRRRGKHLWFELDRRPWPLFHFGMTGSFRAPRQATLELASSPKEHDDTWPPRFTKIHIHTDDGGELVMTNARRLGRIRLRDDPQSESPIGDLGFDPLLDLPTPKRFSDMLRTRSATMKSLLLDQTFAAGVGNWIADEVLYQAGVDPRRRARDLSADEAKRVHRALKRVISTAVRVGSDKRRFPRTWLFHHRWGKDADATTRRGEPIEHLTIAGRTTAWVPSAQA